LQVRLTTVALSRQSRSLTHVPPSPSSIIWYWPNSGDALQLGK